MKKGDIIPLKLIVENFVNDILNKNTPPSIEPDQIADAAVEYFYGEEIWSKFDKVLHDR